MMSAASAASSSVAGRSVGSITLQTLKLDDPWNYRVPAHLQDPHRRRRIHPHMPRDLEPAPLEPTWIPFQPLPRRPWVPLVDCTGVEHQDSVQSLDVRPVRVAENDRVRAFDAPSQRSRQAGVRAIGAQAQRPEQSLRLLQPAAAVAVDDDDGPALDSELAGERPAGRIPI